MNINEIREYLTEISPQWMLGAGVQWKVEDGTEYGVVERRISDEHPRCIDFGETDGGDFCTNIYDDVIGYRVSQHPLPTITRKMLDEALHWEETGEAPEWFPGAITNQLTKESK